MDGGMSYSPGTGRGAESENIVSESAAGCASPSSWRRRAHGCDRFYCRARPLVKPVRPASVFGPGVPVRRVSEPPAPSPDAVLLAPRDSRPLTVFAGIGRALRAFRGPGPARSSRPGTLTWRQGLCASQAPVLLGILMGFPGSEEGAWVTWTPVETTGREFYPGAVNSVRLRFCRGGACSLAALFPGLPACFPPRRPSPPPPPSPCPESPNGTTPEPLAEPTTTTGPAADPTNPQPGRRPPPDPETTTTARRRRPRNHPRPFPEGPAGKARSLARALGCLPEFRRV